MSHSASRLVNPASAILAALAIPLALWNLRAADDGVVATALTVGTTPVTVYRPAVGGPAPVPAPVVVIAHGFAGSQRLMEPFATTFARNGYVAVTFDFPGHGRNPQPLAGSVTEETGATRALVAETARVAAFARPLGDGRLAVLGHSMASDIVVRFARSEGDVAVTIAVSMFSPAVSADGPRNLLIIVGGWEAALQREALRAVGLVAGAAPRDGVTWGAVSDGSARRAAFIPGVEHIGVLYSPVSMGEALAWLDTCFGLSRPGENRLDARGPWIMLLLAAIILLARPLSAMLPRVASPPLGAGLGWRRLWPLLALPALATPFLLRLLPTHFLPVLVADYLAAHFAMYGMLAAAGLAWQRRRRPPMPDRAVAQGRLAVAAGAVTLYGLVGLGLPIDRYVTAFVPDAGRLLLVVAMLAGTLCYFLADEWLTRGAEAARGAVVVSRLAFLLSLALAIALDFDRLFFLVVILPVIVPVFLVFGLFSGWAYRHAGHPFVGAIASAVVFAWAIGVTFPLLSG